MASFMSFALLVILVYGIALLWATWSWRSMNNDQSASSQLPRTTFSIVIPARDEEKNLESCLHGVLKQTYPKDHFEVIVVDDFSEDETVEHAREFKEPFDKKGVSLKIVKKNQESMPGKKGALAKGVDNADFDWVVTTDADTLRGRQWLQAFNDQIINHDPVMISGPVKILQQGNLFQRWQSLEFAGLNALGGVAMNKGRPNMCNGANLAYRKSAYYACKGLEGYENVASGDDEFLMHKIHAHYSSGVRFLKDRRGLVFTYPKESLVDFLSQRIRWASKGQFYENKASAIPALFVGLVNLLLILGVLYAIAYSGMHPGWAIGLWGLKALPEFVFLMGVGRFYQLSHYYLFWLFQPFYPFYILLCGIWGRLGHVSWKSRKIEQGKWKPEKT